jgi:hypothetical protein
MPAGPEFEGKLASVRLGLGAQIFTRLLWNDSGDEYSYTTQFRLLRLQPFMKGYLLSKQLEYKFQMQMRPDSVELMDLFVDYRFAKMAACGLAFIKSVGLKSASIAGNARTCRISASERAIWAPTVSSA